MKNLILFACVALATVACRSTENQNTSVRSGLPYFGPPATFSTTAKFAAGELVFAPDNFNGRVVSSYYTPNGWMYECRMSVVTPTMCAEATRHYKESDLFSFGREDN